MTRKKFTKNELLTMLKEHREQITSISHWNLYSKENELPHSQTLITHFGTWNKFKEQLSLELNGQSRPLKYTDNDLYAVLEKYKEHYTSASKWDLFAEKNQLPKHFIFLDRLGSDVLYERIGLVLSWTTENIKFTILKHFPDSPPTQSEWNALAKVERVPGYMTIVRRFGTWSQMKYEVYYK